MQEVITRLHSHCFPNLELPAVLTETQATYIETQDRYSSPSIYSQGKVHKIEGNCSTNQEINVSYPGSQGLLW